MGAPGVGIICTGNLGASVCHLLRSTGIYIILLSLLCCGSKIKDRVVRISLPPCNTCTATNCMHSC